MSKEMYFVILVLLTIVCIGMLHYVWKNAIASTKTVGRRLSITLLFGGVIGVLVEGVIYTHLYLVHLK